MRWELDDSRPIWPQLRSHMMREIVSGVFPKGSAFPTVRQLAQEAGVNRNTMQRAMAELESDGLLLTNRTVGRTVTTDQALLDEVREQLAAENIRTYLRAMESLGYSAAEAVERMQTARQAPADAAGAQEKVTKGDTI